MIFQGLRSRLEGAIKVPAGALFRDGEVATCSQYDNCLSSYPLSYSSMSAPLTVRQSSSSSTRPARETGALGRGFIFLLAL